MKKIVLAIPHSHTFMWTQTCVASLLRNPPKAEGFDVAIVVIDNSPWSPAIRGITDTSLVCEGKWSDKPSHLKPNAGFESFSVIENHKSNRFHASALDCVVEGTNLPYDFKDFDYLMALETDVLALRPTWLQWFVDQMRPTDFAVGHWHHESFINPSCTLYRGDVLRLMMGWCKSNDQPDVLRWGPNFANVQDIAARQPERDYRDWYNDNVEWIAGPFADKRGWSAGTQLKEPPSGQLKGPGWYEPGQMLHHWAVEAGYTYTVCQTATTKIAGVHGGEMPVQTFYGDHEDSISYACRQLWFEEMQTLAETVHLWGGTRALDIIKHEVTCGFVGANTPFWLEREARFWKASVPPDVQAETLELIRKYGWHYRGCGTPEVTDRDREAVRMVQECYARGGVVI